jgi:hypothetical protein
MANVDKKRIKNRVPYLAAIQFPPSIQEASENRFASLVRNPSGNLWSQNNFQKPLFLFQTRFFQCPSCFSIKVAQSHPLISPFHLSFCLQNHRPPKRGPLKVGRGGSPPPWQLGRQFQVQWPKLRGVSAPIQTHTDRHGPTFV